jgi:hypothetical protein
LDAKVDRPRGKVKGKENYPGDLLTFTDTLRPDQAIAAGNSIGQTL